MSTDTAILAPAGRTYRGDITDPDRWATWKPNKGDILVCTPPKCGTTWTQTILAMLVNGGPDLPQKLPILSPWVDADLGISAKEVSVTLAGQKGRRVVKTHTPGDGFPIWQDVVVIVPSAGFQHDLQQTAFCIAFDQMKMQARFPAAIGGCWHDSALTPPALDVIGEGFRSP